MTNTFFISDTHFGHEGTATKFKREDGSPLRPFSSVEEQDETMVSNWNEVVKEKDRVYHLGDFCMSRRYLSVLERLNGRIAIVLGNHDIWGLKDWNKYPNVDKLLGYRMFPQHGIVCSHIPVSIRQLEGRFKYNVHGHLHHNTMDDPRYVCVCVEHTNYTPVSFDEVLKKCNG